MGYTRDIFALKSMREHAAQLESLRRMIETGDGPMIHPVLAAALHDAGEVAEKAQVVAIIFDPSWSDGYINTRAKVLMDEFSARAEPVLFALLGVPRRRLSPEVQQRARWVLY